MPQDITRSEVQSMVREGAQLLEVLPAEEYEEFHIPGAISMPLKEFSESALARLNKDTAVITYCSDAL
jgi:rhodanese-related sulfurtransferase